ncbi:MAG TPA: HlyD family efflux transporter periplasmic adaptor subunit [Bryobacteraceae bacterium]|jgi:HlyD family secretion protein|nr:HlyD family efflux transporter periplasmic adaptor subunit [Bryobacteraceae bacterium]
MKNPTHIDAQAGRARTVIILIVVLLAAGALTVWRVVLAKPRDPASTIVLSGRIEGDDSAVSSKATGRLLEAKVREGDEVKAGDVIAILDDQQLRDREAEAQATVAQAEARLEFSRKQIAVLEDQLRQNSVETGQSKVDSNGRVSQAQAETAAAEAELAQQEASYKLALFDKDAYTRLARSGAVSERQGKQAETTAETQAALVAAAKRRVEASRGALATAQATLSNPDIHSLQAAMIHRQIAQQEADIASATADEQHARAALLEAKANRTDLTVTAPFDGTVVTRTAEPGEVLTAGTPIITLLDLRKVYLRGYIPEGQIGRVKVGQAARVYLDSNPNQPLDAYVQRIDPQATFTPENTYFRDDRVKEVVGVKLGLRSGFGYAKPGMPADGEVLVSGDAWPPESHRK